LLEGGGLREKRIEGGLVSLVVMEGRPFEPDRVSGEAPSIGLKRKLAIGKPFGKLNWN